MTNQVPNAKPSTSTTVVVVCSTVILALVIVGYFYLVGRGADSSAVTDFLLKILPLVPGLLAYVKVGRIEAPIEQIQSNVNGNLTREKTLSAAALAELPPEKARELVARVDGSPVVPGTIAPSPSGATQG